MKKFIAFLLLAGTFVGLGAGRPASAATVYCTVHAPHNTYVAYLFRTGDPWPTAVSQPFTVDGGKVVAFSGVHGGRWFIRVVESDPYGSLTGQSRDDQLNYYYSTPLNLGDLWVQP